MKKTPILITLFQWSPLTLAHPSVVTEPPLSSDHFKFCLHTFARAQSLLSGSPWSARSISFLTVPVQTMQPFLPLPLSFASLPQPCFTPPTPHPPLLCQSLLLKTILHATLLPSI